MKRLLFIAVMAVLASNLGYAQTNPSASDISNTNVDELSDAQISAYMKRAQESGMTEQQLLLLAKQRGMSEVQIQKLKNRISSLGSGDNQGTLNTGNILRTREANQGNITNPGGDIFESVVKVDSSALYKDWLRDQKMKIFGSEIFQNVNLNFEPSINTPTPKGYQIGAGDEIFIDVWGASEQSYVLTVSPEGLIKIANLGPVYVNGLSVEKAAQKVKRRLSKIYSGLYSREGDGPNTYFQLSLGSLKSINVNVIGEAVYPGTYTLSSFSNMFNAIYYAGGPNNNGSMRSIELIRSNKKIATLDIYDYLINGRLSNNEKLQDQDVILIKPYANRVIVEGAVKRPAIYEVMDKETLSSLINASGGFNEDAYQAKILVKRNTDKEREVVTVEKLNYGTFELSNGDQLTVNSILDKFSNRVQIMGAVNMPGEYELMEGITLKQLIEQAEGLREDAFIGRGLIVRLNNDLTLSNVSFKVDDIISGAKSDIVLQKEDVVRISSIFDIQEAKTLSIRGEVLKEGDFPYITGMTVEDLILLSGGLKESASKSTVQVARRIMNTSENVLLETATTYDFQISDDLRLSEESSDFLLEPYDIVSIRKTPGFTKQILVEIEGEVRYPGKYVLKQRSEKISDLISRAGGLTQFAYPKGAQLIRRTEYYNDINSETNDAIKAKRESLIAIAKQDLLVNNISIKETEIVGIDLVDIISSPKSIGDISLQEGDVISIPKRLETVRVAGEVLYPITTRYLTNQTLKDYLSFAGGSNDQARVRKAFVIYPNGTAARTKGFLWFKKYPKIEPGAEIIIPKRPEKQRMSIQEILAITTSMSTIALLVNSLRP